LVKNNKVTERLICKTPLLLFCCLVLFFYGCSTKKNTLTRRAYHNLTAHYNAYFNGKEALKDGVTQLAKKNKDNYTKVLPVFELGTKSDAQSVYNSMDRAIEKASIIIQKHSIYIKGVEHVKWIDDAFMLIGKSYYYKQEYDLALQTFNYILNKYKDSDLKYEAIIWKARVMIQQGKIDDAEAVLNSIEKKIEKNKANRAADKLFPLAYADVLLKQQKYPEAIEYLQQGLRLNKAKHIRTRLTFILAQAYQHSGNAVQANKYYRKVLGMNPIYDMEFATKINLAKNYEVTMGGGNIIKKKLNHMIHDDKNKEYLDQIYYALAEVNLKENDEETALKNLKKSAQSSVSNDYQKTISYLKLGDLYFAEPDYRNAQTYYDSCVITLPKDFPNYQLIENKKNTLNELVKNLDIVQLEDSLQMLARLSPGERNKKINDHIAELGREEQRKKEEEAKRLNELNQIQQSKLTNNNQTSGSWYFYNPSSMSFGYNEFVHKWGNRKYEDLWRLSNKTASEIRYNDVNEDQDSLKTAESNKEKDLKDPKYYLAQIPMTPEAIEKSDKKISEALFNIGVIYKESLDDYDKAIEAFNKIEKKYSASKQILATYYNLYQIYQEKNETSKANYYKDLVITNYPESDYAKIITDPQYYEKLQEQNGRLAVFYKETYLAFKEAKYALVIKNSDSIILLKKDPVLTSKFDFIRSMAIGKTRPKDVFITSLKSVVKKYPDTDVKTEAQKIIDFYEKPADNNILLDGSINKDSSGVVNQNTGLYKFDPTAFHFYLVVFDVKNVSINDIKNSFSNHNTKLFSSKNLTINTLFLDDKHEVLSVSKFENKDDALNYLLSIEHAPEILNLISKAQFKHFVISAANYPVFYKSKDVDKYMMFYKANYSKQ
jgi:tetratricopeptide (TPR) repeat protein